VSERLRGNLATFGQIVCFPMFWFIAHVICHVKVQSELKTLPKGRKAHFIIAANHQSALDPFVITGVISPHFWSKLLPYRYITANQYLYKPKYIWFLWPLGGFPAYDTQREVWGLRRAQNILDSGQTVCIFPEGQRARKHEVKPKKGVSILANSPNTYIIPIKLKWQLKPRQVTLSIGKAYKAQGHTPDDILNKIYALPDLE
jgi:1-acyl-sn-glycerol-3-phosphate acyltransferase